MVCCTTLAALLALLLRPVLALRGSPLAWRPEHMAIDQALRASSRLQSFVHAFAGLRFLIRNEPNMRIHAAAGLAAMTAGLWFHIAMSEWRWLIVAIALVTASEALNTAVEQACNAVTVTYHPAIKAAKDVAAGAVLIAAICAGLIGCSIFLPHVVRSFQLHGAFLGVSICQSMP